MTPAEDTTSFTCPTCGSAQNIPPSTQSTTCPVCAESFELLYLQQCPGCGMKSESREKLTYCPDCDTRFPEATSSWACTTPLATCPTCNHSWERQEAGKLACPHCQSTREFNRETREWELKLPLIPCACGQTLFARQSPAGCPSCKRRYRLNPDSGRWEEVEIDFTCPTCGSSKKISPGSVTTTCDTCEDSFSRKYQQQCSGCGITLTNDTPATHCPDCDSPLPEAQSSWLCTTNTRNCRFCGHKLDLISPGHQQCPHCQYNREYDKSEQGWYYTMGPNTCSCGHSYSPLETPHTCPKCERQYQLNTTSGKWEELITHMNFCCPDCRENQRLPLDAKQTTCRRCGHNFVRRLVQTCPKCKNVVINGTSSTPCEKCGTTLPEAQPGWVCTTSPGKCPVCGSSIRRNVAENKLQCPNCMLLRYFNTNTNAWEHSCGQITCDCKQKISLTSNPVTCASCKRRYELNYNTHKWVQSSAPAPKPAPAPAPKPKPQPAPQPQPTPTPGNAEAPPTHGMLAWSALLLTILAGLHNGDFYYFFNLLFSIPAVMRAHEAGKVKEKGIESCRDASEEAKALGYVSFGFMVVLYVVGWMFS